MTYTIKMNFFIKQILSNILMPMFQFIKKEIEMIKKNMIKFFCLTCSLTLLLSCPITVINTQAIGYSPQSSSNSETIQPRAAIIEWVFKEFNGKMYRRLYNFQTKEWIGDWILCE